MISVPFLNWKKYAKEGETKTMSIFEQLLANRILLAGITGWATAQVLKTIIYAILNKEISFERLFGDGGMPSGHSATVSAMATMSLLHYGIGSFEFAVTAMLAIIVMHDAMGVRLETGKQAKVINEMIELLTEKNYVQAFSEERLKEFVGHTPLQVGAGCILGILIGVLLYI